jgi:NTE family protein
LSLRQVDFRLISPSIALEKIAIGHMHTLPRTIRTLLFTLGALKKSGSNLVSYLLFEREYCRALIKLGYDDTMQRRDDLMQFLGYEACWL